MEARKKEENISKGAVLREARKKKKLTLEMVHEATNIPMDVLRGIEEGYQVRTISSFYYKGFLKLYANYLNVDVKNVLENHQKEQLPKYVKRDVDEFDLKEWISKLLTRRQKQRLVIVLGSLFALFLVFKIISFLTHRPSSDKAKKSVKNAVVQKDVNRKLLKEKKIIQKENKKQLKKKESPPKKSIQSVKTVDRKKSGDIKQKKDPKIVAPKTIQANTVKTASSSVEPIKEVRKDVTLTVRAKKQCWLRVKSDGIIVFQSTLRLGAVETWMANEKIEISGRNINQLEFELNGKMIGSLGRKDHGAKGLIVTKEGLNVTNKR